MTKLGMIGSDGFTFFYGLEDIHHICFMKAEDFYNDLDDIYSGGFKPETVLIVITFNDRKAYTFDSDKYTIYFE